MPESKVLCLLFDQTTTLKICELCQQNSEQGAKVRNNFLSAFKKTYSSHFYCPQPDFDNPDPHPVVLKRDMVDASRQALPLLKDGAERDITLCAGYDGEGLQEKKCCGGKIKQVNMVTCNVLKKSLFPQYCQKCILYKIGG